jgi:tRNA (cmo5U34)-methyltransferase
MVPEAAGGDVVRDEIFAEEDRQSNDFSFGEETAEVFDDMLVRSVPYYLEIQRMVGELVGRFSTDDSSIWDLGCSTCNTFLSMEKAIEERKNLRLVGLDSSEAMLKRARAKLLESGLKCEHDLRQCDLHDPLKIDNASVVMSVLTLQFVRPMHRERIVKEIYDGLNPGGCLILVEKVLGENPAFNRHFIDFYYEAKKKNGYSELEIAQKREALENILVPYRLNEYLDLINTTGFRAQEVFFKWYNFCGIVAMK